jgi:hypothetical protein
MSPAFTVGIIAVMAILLVYNEIRYRMLMWDLIKIERKLAKYEENLPDRGD